MITIKKPELSELDYVSKLWADEKTMEDTGGIHILDPKDYDSFYKNKVCPTDSFSQFFLILNNNEPIGEVAFNNLHKETKTASLSIRIEYSKRRMSHATQALKLFCDFYFNELNCDVLEDFVSSPSGIKFLKKINFPYKKVESMNDISECGKTIMQKYNIPLEDYRQNICLYFRLTKEDYEQGILEL